MESNCKLNDKVLLLAANIDNVFTETELSNLANVVGGQENITSTTLDQLGSWKYLNKLSMLSTVI